MNQTYIDLIVYNALLYDPADGLLRETALAVCKDTVCLTGDDESVLSMKQSKTRVIDAGGRFILPAFMDCHTHFIGYVRRQQEVRLEDARSLPEALARIRKKVEETSEGGWITGGGWNHNLWGEGEYPHRKYLDEISERHFIALDSKDWHTCWVNSPVLKKAGYSADKPYPGAGPLAVHPQTGEFTGVLEENARLIVYELMPKLTFGGIRDHFLKITQNFFRYGFSAVHTVETGDEFRIFQEAYREEKLGLRTFWYMPHKHIESVVEIGLQQDLGSDFLKISGVKMFVDGSFGSQTAELLENYDGSDHAGVESMTESELMDRIGKAVAARLSCAIHAIGDKAIRKTLQVLAHFTKQSIDSDLRHRIEHVQLVQPDDLDLFGKSKIYASIQPIHLANDIPVIMDHLKSRAHLTYPFGSLYKKNIPLIFGSDIPIEDFHPWKAIYTAMERKYHFEPGNETFFREQCLDLDTCLKAYTLTAAASVGMEQKLGRIRSGWLADFFVAEMNPFRVTTDELLENKSVLTVVNGKVVWDELS